MCTMFRTLQKRVTVGLSAQWSRMVSNTAVDSPNLTDDFTETDTKRRSERCLNRVTLIGRVGKEPEQRGSAEHPCLIFPLATNMYYRKANGERLSKTDWHRVAVFKPSLRDVIATRISKGDRVLVEGSLSYMKYTDQDNKTVTISSISADNILFLRQRYSQDPPSDDE